MTLPWGSAGSSVHSDQISVSPIPTNSLRSANTTLKCIRPPDMSHPRTRLLRFPCPRPSNRSMKLALRLSLIVPAPPPTSVPPPFGLLSPRCKTSFGGRSSGKCIIPANCAWKAYKLSRASCVAQRVAKWSSARFRRAVEASGVCILSVWALGVSVALAAPPREERER